MTEIALHNWQKQALKEWINNKGQGIIQAPTGVGKAYLGPKLIEKEKECCHFLKNVSLLK